MSLYLIELTSIRTGRRIGYVMRLERGKPIYPQTFTRAQAELECARLGGRLRPLQVLALPIAWQGPVARFYSGSSAAPVS